MEGDQLAQHGAAHARGQDPAGQADAACAARDALHRCGLPSQRQPSQPTLGAAVAAHAALATAITAAADSAGVATAAVAAAIAAATLPTTIPAALAAAAIATAPDGAAAAALTAVA